METLEPPPYRTLHRGHARTPPARVEVDAWGRLAVPCEEKSGHRSD